MKLSRVSLGSAGLTHVKDRLGGNEYASNKPLRHALLKLSIDQGEVWTWAAPTATFTLLDLHAGGLPDGITQEDHRDVMTDFSVDYLAGTGRLAIIEDHDSTPFDPWLTKEARLPAGLPRLAVDDHLYWYTTEPRRGLVSDLTLWGFGLFKCMALTHTSGPWPPASPLTPADFDVLANRTDHIVVDAFDFEGFVVWSRTPRPAE